MKCAFAQPRANNFTIFWDGLTLRSYASVQTSPFVNSNGKVFMSSSESREEIQADARAAHIHLSTKFDPTIDISTILFERGSLTCSTPPSDYIGRIQDFATTTGEFLLRLTQLPF